MYGTILLYTRITRLFNWIVEKLGEFLPSLPFTHLTSPHLLQSAATLNVSDPADVITNATYQKVCQCSANYTALTAAAAKYSVGDVDTSGSSVQVADSIFNTTKEAAQPFLDFLQGTGKNLHAPTAGRCRFTVWASALTQSVFLVACTRLYSSLCRSVGLSVLLSVITLCFFNFFCTF